MKYILSLSLVCLCLLGKAQNDSKDVKFINSVLDTTILFRAKGFYSDKISYHQIDEMRESLNKDTLFSNNWPKREVTYLVFSTEERAHINREIDKFINFKWRDGLVPQLKMISADTIKSIFADRLKSWRYFYNKYGLYIHEFTKPIFLRNNTICIFYKQFVCGDLCGFGTFDVYLLKEGKWVAEYHISSWIS